MVQTINLQVNTDLTASSEVLSWFEQINQPPIPEPEIWWKCQTLLIEGFTNIVEHAHKNLPPETLVEIEAIRSSQEIQIRIWSQGQFFDLEKKLQETCEFEENEQERGRGLRIMSAIADKLSYERTADNRYCLFISKNVSRGGFT
ncbi:putative anti-sigma regulatory factor serine/threonine protein kinase [Calothrix sp. NIES-4071]|nr:putative anti-sigma regulatory factor serine/threonine protein kinase [Calothrix sp. NIES-4071]BAZ60914.1 putative anti-sigma regulatory factor serine/threonine protein kinase [Calothrix sp. NIES-4105]